MSGVPILAGRQIGQVGIIVTDVERALERYAATGSGSPWRVYTYGPETVAELSYRGERSDYSMRIALGPQTPQIELIEPLTGPSIYHDWRDTHGEGLHHAGVYVDSLDSAIEEMGAAGYDVIQSGHGTGADGTGGYAYFSTETDLSMILEAIEVPTRRREPEAVWS